MTRLLVHIATGPETRLARPWDCWSRGRPSRPVTRSICSSPGTASGSCVPRHSTPAHGIGTGAFRDHIDALVSGGATLYASGMSSKARGLTPDGRRHVARHDVAASQARRVGVRRGPRPDVLRTAGPSHGCIDPPVTIVQRASALPRSSLMSRRTIRLEAPRPVFRAMTSARAADTWPGSIPLQVDLRRDDATQPTEADRPARPRPGRSSRASVAAAQQRRPGTGAARRSRSRRR